MAAAHQSTYEHQPLTLPKSIRIVIVKPAVSLEAPVECTLDEVDLDNIIPSSSYEALSYVWGERVGTIPILCHGRKLLVTPNCYDALIHLRLPSKHRRLFVDAVCIDQRLDLQQSINERDHQIAIMGEVYERAHRVMIWLGKPHPSTPVLMSVARFIHRAKRIESATKIKLMSTSAKAYIKWLKGFRKVDLTGLDEAFYYFIKHPWFTRTWTLQEQFFAKTKNIVIVYGCQQIKYVIMVLIINSLNFWDLLGESWKEVESIKTIAHRDTLCRETFSSPSPSPSPSPMYTTAQYFRIILDPRGFLGVVAALTSTNPQDKIFGIYNIFSRLNLNLPRPDSSQSVAEIFEATSKEIIKRTASLDILMLCFKEASIIKNLPSWVPDWSMNLPSKADPVAINASQFLDSGTYYKAARNTGVEINEASNLGKLVVRGTVFTKIHFRTVSSIIRTYDEHANVGDSKLHFQDFIQACRRWAQHIAISSIYPSGCPTIDAVRRTLLLSDRAETARHPQNQEKQTLESFLECFDIMMYPDCKIYDSAVIKAKFIDPVLETYTLDEVIEAGFDIEKVLSMALYTWKSGSSGMRTMFPSRIPGWQHMRIVTYDSMMEWANYALMVLDTGHFARGFRICKEGDIVALLAGCEFPVALRPDGNGNYRFVAPLYVDGIMHGEAWPEDESELEEITLV
ncbi:heterokaryon incompatibility protein-domain-containing protein [Xylaria flabelliformis]|nr:heterokaryon incompatibility protein-domain-containing protein [Xylaria flabelliformis]